MSISATILFSSLSFSCWACIWCSSLLLTQQSQGYKLKLDLKQVEISCLLLGGTSKREALKTYSASSVKINLLLAFFLVMYFAHASDFFYCTLRNALWLWARRQIHMSTNLTASSILASVLYLTPAWSFVQASFCRVWTLFEILSWTALFCWVHACNISEILWEQMVQPGKVESTILVNIMPKIKNNKLFLFEHQVLGCQYTFKCQYTMRKIWTGHQFICYLGYAYCAFNNFSSLLIWYQPHKFKL